MAQALRNWDRWSIPSDKELTMLKELDLYKEIDHSKVPPGCQILPTKMDFKTKFDSRGVKIKDKCRLVVLGNLGTISLLPHIPKLSIFSWPWQLSEMLLWMVWISTEPLSLQKLMSQSM
jgi:hypothetical protein